MRSGGITKWAGKVYDQMIYRFNRLELKGDLPDQIEMYLRIEGAKGSTHDDLWMDYLKKAGATGDDWEELERSWLESMNYSGTVDLMLENYWRDQVAIPTGQELLDQQVRPMKLELAKLIREQPDSGLEDLDIWLYRINRLKLQIHLRDRKGINTSVLYEGTPVHPLPGEAPYEAFIRQKAEALTQQQEKTARRVGCPRWFMDLPARN